MGNPIPQGATAPEFSLQRTPDQKLALSDLRGRPVVLVFYPADFSPVCGDELDLFNEVWPEFQRFRAEVLGLSVDGAWCHAAYAREHNLRFPLLADFEPKGGVARQYGVYREDDGVSERALFVVGADGRVAWRYVSPIAVNPGAEGVLEALERMEAQEKKGAAQ